MANNILPRIIVIRPISPRLYACYMNEPQSVRGFVSCREEGVFEPFSKIEVEISTSDTRYVHLRFSHTNKYWGMRPDGMIVASSVEPVEDRSNPACTLFEPTFLAGISGSFSLTHVQRRRRLTLGSQYHITVNLSTSSTFTPFTFVNWATLVKLPRHVTFKGGVNDRYLEARRQDGNRPYLELRGQDPNHGSVAHEVFMEHDGHLRIRSVHYGRFWRGPNWIWGDSSDSNGNDRATLFWPVKLNDNTIALRNAGNNRFCKRLTAEGKTSCLNAGADNIENEARLQVEELVLERRITNVRYRMDEARVYDTEPFTAGYGAASNPSYTASSTLALRVQYTVTTSRTFNYSYSLTVGVSTTIEAGIPLIASGGVEISASSTHTVEMGRAREESYETEAVYTVTVPPRSRTRVNYVGTRGRCSIPFSYVRTDTRSNNGDIDRPTQNVDGVFEGVNGYSFDFDELPFEPI